MWAVQALTSLTLVMSVIVLIRLKKLIASHKEREKLTDEGRNENV